jgi:hypothetical protein
MSACICFGPAAIAEIAGLDYIATPSSAQVSNGVVKIGMLTDRAFPFVRE